MRWDIACFSLRGERDINEDCVMLLRESDFLCAVLCDGLGGHEGGEIASSCVCESIRKTVTANRGGQPLDELIQHAINKAQSDLLEEQILRKKRDAMKTTLTCLILSKNQAVAAYIGDSRIYRFHNGLLKSRTQDHSVPQFLVNTGEIKESQIRHHEDRNKLLRVMGTEWETPRYQMWEIPELCKGDTFLMCSDGFWEWIDEKQMMRSLVFSRSAESWLEKMRRQVEENGHGKGMDNLSAIAVKII